MTDTTDPGGTAQARRRHGRRIVVRCVWAVVLLAPPVVLWVMGAADAAQHKSPTDWVGNHRAKVALENAALLIAGLPAAGVVIGALAGALRRPPRTGLWAATGAVLGALALWAFGAYAFLTALRHLTIVF
ncbi:hypothetical protein ACFYYN_25990 [Streptomyces sp. NPDC001902]|nr:hypothetical protein [Streptomyces sp. PA03-1a]MDX2817735.1 hypothetical protein [Streptomyces sp. PA03-5A]